MNNPHNESWQRVCGRVFIRLLFLLLLYVPVSLAPWVFTIALCFPNQHPYQNIVTGEPDYEQVPDALNALAHYVAVPIWYLYGLFAGFLAGRKTSDTVRNCFLSVLGIVLTMLSLFSPGVFLMRGKPVWPAEIAAFAGAVLASSFFAQRAQRKHRKTNP